MSRDALRAFKAAAWNSEEELGAFAVAASAIGPAELTKWVSVLVDPAAQTDRAAQQRRHRVFAYVAERTNDPSLFVPYVRALRGADAPLRALLVSLLPRANSVSGHMELCRLLGAPEAELRAAATKVLAQIAGKVAFDAVVELVAEPWFAGRIDAIDLMLPRAQHQSVPLLAAVLASGAQHERTHALRALADKCFAQHPLVAADTASRVLADRDDRIVSQAVSVLAHYAPEDVFHERVQHLLFSDEPVREKAVIDALRRFPTARTIQLLTRKLRDGTGVVRVAVMETAEAIGTDVVLPLLVEGLTHGELLVRTAALNAVGRLAESGSLDPARAILWLLRSRDVNVRRIAIEVLHRVGDPKGELAPRLLAFLRDEDWWVRERTMDALIEMAGSGLTRHLIPYLFEPSPVVRRFAVAALKRIRDPSTLNSLLKCARTDADWWVREEAIAAVAHMGDRRVIQHIVTISTEQPEMRVACVQALVDMKATEVIDHLVALIGEDDPDVRVAAVRAVAELGGRDYASVIEPLIEDPVPRVQRAARELLAVWKVHAETSIRRNVALDGLLAAVVEGDADDLLLFAGRVPYVKRRGQVEVLHGWKPLSGETLRGLIQPFLSVVQKKQFESGRDVDFSHEMRALGARFRVNLFMQATGVAAVFRIVKNDALLIVLENLGLPPSVGALSDLKDGLVLVGGPTGAGKSTTLAALVDRINRTQARHIVTIEDPIETVHIGERSLVTQRELGSHTSSFPTALRAALRQDPDVIVVGEMRDPETFQFAVSAAETGHLVLGTMHTPSAETSVARIVNAFPVSQQPQVRAMLAASLKAVVCQSLLRRKNGEGRVVAAEVMLNNDAIANLIRKGKEFQIPTAIATGRHQGMQLMDQELARLVREDIIEPDEAFARAVDKLGFQALVSGKDPNAMRGAPPTSSSRMPGASVVPGAPPGNPTIPPNPSQRPVRL
jgi:twitching motility protein PilT